METVSLRKFVRDAELRRRTLRLQRIVRVCERTKHGKETFYVFPEDHESKEVKKNGKKAHWLEKFVGAWGVEKKPMTVAQEKVEIQNLWLDND